MTTFEDDTDIQSLKAEIAELRQALTERNTSASYAGQASMPSHSSLAVEQQHETQHKQQRPLTFKQYQTMRKANPRLYYSAQVQREMFEDREILGSNAFYD